MSIVYDVNRHKIVPVGEKSPVRIVGWMSYERLVELLVATGQVNSKEIVTHLEMTDDGVVFYVKAKEKAGN